MRASRRRLSRARTSHRNPMRSHECISWACSPSDGMKTSANGGADPLVRAGPPGPAASSIDKYQQQADVGVGRGPGGPPHLVACATSVLHRAASGAARLHPNRTCALLLIAPRVPWLASAPDSRVNLESLEPFPLRYSQSLHPPPD